MDEKYLEQAGAIADTHNKAGVAACSKAAIPSEDLDETKYKTRYCLESDCGVELPLFRMQKGLELCVDCQSAKEKRQKR